MANIRKNIEEVRKNLQNNVKLIVVTKMHSVEELQQVYDTGERVFGENRPQELCAKHTVMPSDIEWHLIGTLQSNKVRSIVPFVKMIHSIDSEKLLETVNKEAMKCGRILDVLMEVFVATEESKHGWNGDELIRFMESGRVSELKNVRIRGIMGMASFTDDEQQVRSEFRMLKQIFDTLKSGRAEFDTLSMGMSGDYRIAMEEGSTMVRVGSVIFKK